MYGVTTRKLKICLKIKKIKNKSFLGTICRC